MGKNWILSWFTQRKSSASASDGIISSVDEMRIPILTGAIKHILFTKNSCHSGSQRRIAAREEVQLRVE